jgi:acyl dehydratase
MFTMALAGRALVEWVGDPGAVIEFGVRFTRPVLVPDDDSGAGLEVAGTVRAVAEDGTATVDLTVCSAGEKVLGQARARVRGPAGP